jgi:superfamily II DNA or RNA helicase
LNGIGIDVGIVGGNKCDIKDINVVTVQTAIKACGEKYEKFDEEDGLEDDSILDSRRSEIYNLITNAKGIAADEIQHWASKSCQVISDYSSGARYRWGLSATPYRDKGDDILIDACFGKVIADINASFLIERKYLVPPTIHFIPISNMYGKHFPSNYHTVYTSAIVENAERNKIIADLASAMAAEGKTVLVLCTRVAHGKMLNSLIDNSIFLHGATSDTVRKEHLQKMRDKKAPITVATVIFDEGIDVCALDTLILAGAGRSQTRALQRVGRTLRPYPGKTESTVIDFWDNCKYLLSHARKRKKIYETESLFKIEMMGKP